MSQASDKHIFFADLDGTLLDSTKQITPKTYDAVKRFTEAGNIFSICTGRSCESAQSVHKELKLDFPNSMVCSFNGGLIQEPFSGKEIFRIGMDKQDVLDIIEYAKSIHLHVQTYSDDLILTPYDDKELAHYRKVIHTPYVAAEDLSPYLPENPCKIIVISLDHPELLETFRMAVEEKYSDRYKLVYSCAEYLEVIPKSSGKGTAVRKLSEYLGIPVENTIAAGDADNDLEMIEAAGLGVAMLNGSDSVKAIANVITTEDNNHDGLVAILEQYC